MTLRHSIVIVKTLTLASLVVLVVCGLEASCTSIRTDKIAAFSTAVTTAKSQATAAFAAVNEVTKEEVIDYAAAQPTLKDENFYDVLDKSSIAQTEAVFAGIEKYCQSLATLASPDLNKEYKTATVELASQINESEAKVKKLGLASSAPVLSPGVATAFAELGNIVIKAKAAAEAKRTIQSADPVVEKIFHAMGDSIETIRGTVHAHWRHRRDVKAVEFIQPENTEKKRAIAAAFGELKDKEAAQDRALTSLQRSLRALADAHHALAADSQFGVATAIGVVKDEAKETKDIYDRIRAGPSEGTSAQSEAKPKKGEAKMKTQNLEQSSTPSE
jgi:hypothetical protein